MGVGVWFRGVDLDYGLEVGIRGGGQDWDWSRGRGQVSEHRFESRFEIEVGSRNWEFGTGVRVGVQDRGRLSGLSFGAIGSGFRTMVKIRDWGRDGTWVEVRLWTVLGRVSEQRSGSRFEIVIGVGFRD
ncbi:hypothetical protein TIFTF001_023745 [Ficus carica]|uniref:Uncharacterized protein n=1 Tax=Ficus carica TaxID=3494 RepID=A0AA88AX89_FICCA|nr:hypothetical protein TIFTF001_023745 [Ficus carica]